MSKKTSDRREYNREYREKHRQDLNESGRVRYHAMRETEEGKVHLSRLVAETRKRKKDWIVQYKEKLGCQDCNRKLPHYVLEFDHCRGEKKFSLGMIAHRSWEDITSEVEKCDVVCANCHKARDWHRWRKYVGSHDIAKNGCLSCGGHLTRKYQLVFCSAPCRDKWKREASPWANGALTENQVRHRKARRRS